MELRTSWSFILKAIKPFRLYIIGIIGIAFVWALLINAQPYIMKIILNKAMHIDDQGVLQDIAYLMGVYVSLSFIYIAIFRLYDWIVMKFRPAIKKHISMMLMNKMMEHSHSFYQKHFTGSLTTRIVDIVIGVPDILRILIDRLLGCFLMLFFALYNMSLIHVKFALVLGVWVFFFLGVSLFLVFRNQHLANRVATARAVLTGNIVDVFTNMPSIRLFATRQFEDAYLERTAQNSVEKDQERDWFFVKLHAFQGGSFLILEMVCFWWLFKGLSTKMVQPGDFALVVTLNIFIIENFWNIAKEMRDFWEKMGNISQGLAIIESLTEIEDKSNAKDLVVSQGEITFENVQFQYKDAESLFEHESVVIKPGQKVGLVGYSGSGKSTFVNLILRLFNVTAGSIKIDGQDISSVTQDSLRRHISIIPQDPSLFHRSIMENIKYGRMNASDEEVILAAKRAYAHEFITELSQGYDMLVGERGAKLSGGQRQRIVIARAILKNAPILILDEATSQLDSVTETQIQNSLLELMKDKTTLVIAHRLSTLLSMDRILVFHQGSIVEDGSHEQLLARNGMYKQLWDAQVGGFLYDDNDN